MSDSTKLRLQKVLAERGVASRRHAADIIQAGRVTVNGETTLEAGLRVDPLEDRITVDGEPLPQERERIRTILIYKPRGYICSTNEEQGKTIYELIRDIPERLVPAGRLDKASEGLLIMTNDGPLHHRLTHPSHEHEKVYEVTVGGVVTESARKILRSALVIDGHEIQPVQVMVLGTTKTGCTLLQFKLKEGRNRQIRKMCAAAKLTVLRLVRTSIEGIPKFDLKPGEWVDLLPPG